MVTPYFPPIINGPSIHVYHLVKGLISNGVDVEVHTMSYDSAESIMNPNLDYKGFTSSHFKPISLFRGASFDQPLSISYVKSAIEKSSRFDIIHIHDFPKLCNDALILLLKKINPQKPIILTPHGAGPLSPAYKFSSKIYWASGIPLKVIKSADSLITVTHLQKMVFARVCDEQKISMIYEAIPSNYFVKSPSFKDNGKLKVLFIGRIIKEKGIADLLRAISFVTEISNNCVELVCIGPDYGFMTEALNIIKNLNLEKVVHLLGPLPEDQKLLYLNWCDVLVLPSYYEAFGIPIVEAMAHGKPVIATKTIGALSLIKHNKTGFIINFSDPTAMAKKLLQFIENPELKYHMGQQALLSVRSFTMDVMIKQHISLYKKINNTRN